MTSGQIVGPTLEGRPKAIRLFRSTLIRMMSTRCGGGHLGSSHRIVKGTLIPVVVASSLTNNILRDLNMSTVEGRRTRWSCAMRHKRTKESLLHPPCRLVSIKMAPRGHDAARVSGELGEGCQMHQWHTSTNRKTTKHF